jgi:hypothetical protein
MGNSNGGETERRKYARILKSFKLSFYLKDMPTYRNEGTFFTKDISKGGLRFMASQSIKEGLPIVFEISTPFTAPNTLNLEGTVVSSEKVNPGILYIIRVKFNSMDNQAMQVLDKIEKQHLRGL